MTLYETYTLLFTDVFVSNLAFNSSVEIIFDSMRIFGHYNIFHILLVRAAAYTSSVIINYFFGTLCYKILAPLNKNNNANSDVISKLNSKIKILLITLSCIPILGKFIILFMGFSKVSFRQVFFISVIAKLAYYFIDIIFF